MRGGGKVTMISHGVEISIAGGVGDHLLDPSGAPFIGAPLATTLARETSHLSQVDSTHETP